MFYDLQHLLNRLARGLRYFHDVELLCPFDEFQRNLIFNRSMFMAALLSQDQVKFSELPSEFSNKIFVSCLKLSKKYSPSVFLQDGLKLYVFESLTF